MKSYDVVICGAGVAGVSAAYFLVQAGIRSVLLIDERAPLSLTSDRSTECYRNWWPDPALLALMNRSIELMETIASETRNVFQLNRRGYLYLTAREESIPSMVENASGISALGAGPLREHRSVQSSVYQPSPAEGYENSPAGADLLLDPDIIHKYCPAVSKKVIAGLHVRKAGWLSAQQLGMHLLSQSRAAGVQFKSGRVTRVDTLNGEIKQVQLSDGETIATGILVNAAGPFLKELGKLVGLDLPVYTELHLKAAYKDPHGVLDRASPLLIWLDPQFLEWSREERSILAEDPSSQWMFQEFPSGAHIRPEGGAESQTILLLWEYQQKKVDPTWPPEMDELYPEIALRGMSRMLPGLRQYIDRAARPALDGGYYTKTPENRPIICPTPVDGFYVYGALSGYGIMSACAGGELLASLVAGQDPPVYAPHFDLVRYQDPAYQEWLVNFSDSGQL